jgi:hypothetical protein
MRPIELADLEFDEIEITRLSSLGNPYRSWVRVGVPRIPQNVVDCTFFLYRNREEAEAGRNPRGTGFVVEYPHAGESGRELLRSYYAITNWHVACDGGASVIRVNLSRGDTEVFEFEPDQWHFIPGKMDVAVVPLDLDHGRHRIASISIHMFAHAPHDQWGNGIFVGDDVFMIGMFFDHQAQSKNLPAARFGNISMLPDKEALIKQPTRYRGLSYIVDMHSRTGFSGSPVFMYRTFGSDLARSDHRFEALQMDRRGTDITGEIPKFLVSGKLNIKPVLKLLGIHWGQFPEEWEITGKRKKTNRSENAAGSSATLTEYVEGVSGMTCVIPAWEILEILELPKYQKLRKEKEAASEPDTSPRPESVPPRASDANPTHQEDFSRLLNAASKTPPQGD